MMNNNIAKRHQSADELLADMAAVRAGAAQNTQGNPLNNAPKEPNLSGYAQPDINMVYNAPPIRRDNPSRTTKRLICAAIIALPVCCISFFLLFFATPLASFCYKLSSDNTGYITTFPDEDAGYRECLALAAYVRNEDFETIENDLIQIAGSAEDVNFLNEYERLFRDIVPDDSDELSVQFRDCCYMVSYVEFAAKLTMAKSERFLGFFYVEDADKYRIHADYLWELLNNAHTHEQMQEIIDYCDVNELISLRSYVDADDEAVDVSPADMGE